MQSSFLDAIDSYNHLNKSDSEVPVETWWADEIIKQAEFSVVLGTGDKESILYKGIADVIFTNGSGELRRAKYNVEMLGKYGFEFNASLSISSSSYKREVELSESHERFFQSFTGVFAGAGLSKDAGPFASLGLTYTTTVNEERTKLMFDKDICKGPGFTMGLGFSYKGSAAFTDYSLIEGSEEIFEAGSWYRDSMGEIQRINGK